MAELTKLNFIQYLCEKKLIKLGLQDNKDYINRLERELTNVDVQEIHDYVLKVLKSKIKIPTHHSLMYYLLDISETDPIKAGIDVKIKKPSSFPDIDTDFSVNEREWVVKYFIDKYGNDHVAPIGSYGQMKMKMVIRDIARIYDIDIHDTNDVAKNLQDDVDNMTEEEFDIIIAKEPGDEGFRNDLYELRKYFERHTEIRDIIFKLKGQLRHLTKHPAGVVATPGNIDESIPLMKHKDELVTSWVDGITRKDLQSSGFIKFDILGLKTLTIVKEILELIISRKAYNPEADFDIEPLNHGQHTSLLYEEFSANLSLDGNDKVYEKFRQADTNGIFQFECITGDAWIGNWRMKNLYAKFCKNPEKTNRIASLKFRGRYKVRQRIAAMSKKISDVYRLVAGDDNMCIEATALHQFYTNHSWKKLEDITTEDYVFIDREKNRYQYYCEVYDFVLDIPGTGKKCKYCIRDGKRVCSSKILQVLKKEKVYNNHRYKFIKVKSITYVGKKEVYDIGFKEGQHHNYIASGFVVHNSALMRSLLKEIKPTSFIDITSATALGRPGPLDMGMHKEYAARKNGKQFDYGSPKIEECLKESYGILVYQEDVMRLCNIVAGFPLDLTDTVRKNLMKSVRDGDAKDKAAKERTKIHDMFIAGFEKNNLKKDVAESWWQSCVSFARYGFNKCLTGDTILTRICYRKNQVINSDHIKKQVTIKELYLLKKKSLNKSTNEHFYVLAMANNKVKTDEIKDIIYNGKKSVFKIKTKNFDIEATGNHKFLSDSGWKLVDDFLPGDLIAITEDKKCIIFDEIISKEYTGEKDVYDIEMYGDEHNFVANGFISHNSHAVAYTVLSYQMMWFKIYYPLEFYVVLFSNSLAEKFTSYFGEAMNKGINIVPVNINTAKSGFSIHNNENSIMFGIGHIMGVGPAIINVIMSTQPFESFEDFYEKTAKIKKVGKAAMEALINAHAFDCFGSQNEILEKYYKEIRKEKNWERTVDYENKKFEHEKFLEAYSLDWRVKLSDDQKKEINRLGAKLLTKFVQPKLRTKMTVWGIITEVIKKTSQNGNEYYYVVLTDSKFNIAKLRIPTYNRRCKKAFLLDRENSKYRKVDVDDDVIKVDNILIGEAETSEYLGRVFADLYNICCLGSIYEKTLEQKERLAKYDEMFKQQ